MEPVFANPLGFLALLGVPVVLAIHCLQRKSRRLVVSTLFLLEQVATVSASGSRLDRLRNSLPLWLQLLAVLLATWLLVQPQFLREDSRQLVVAVLDSSVSMMPFRERALTRLDSALEAFENSAARSHWILLETDPASPTLYSGEHRAELLAAARQWTPRLGTHDVTNVLREAVALARGGSAIFVTDHSQELPVGATLLAVGEPIRNWGFCGVRADGNGWRALVINLGGAEESRTVTIDGVSRESVTLKDGGMTEISGTFPENGRVELRLESDGFGVDNYLPIVRPVRKPLEVHLAPGTPFEEFFRQFRELFDGQRAGGQQLLLAAYDPLSPSLPPGNAIVFAADPGPPGPLLTGDIAAERSPLTEGLLWDGLQSRETMGFTPRPGDRTLLWQSDSPLIILRGDPGEEKLLINFDVRHSNARRWPAFLILLHRFAESLRASRPGHETFNAELGQPLSQGLRAPFEPGFFDLAGVNGAAHFADAREADFRQAGALSTLVSAMEAVSQRNRRPDPLASLWILLLGIVVMAHWHLTGAAAGTSRRPVEQN